jgi:hypothetical protein
MDAIFKSDSGRAPEAASAVGATDTLDDANQGVFSGCMSVLYVALP